ncbi:uncharacterized protein LOC106088626 isoform X2 [Stomoxys calcitrans]|uniref:uncharacterized protein LOC106088626 isoform X2 n=1 Tax=Stomoxys calcitrans TaxID=35570 RepID=UPI0027E2E6C2|nr:uncharacterized protein LOC106088626 isoform X2 [Stomoxys calcitrans]
MHTLVSCNKICEIKSNGAKMYVFATIYEKCLVSKIEFPTLITASVNSTQPRRRSLRLSQKPYRSYKYLINGHSRKSLASIEKLAVNMKSSMANINISPQTVFSSSPELEVNQNSNANSTTSDQELCHSYSYKKGTDIKQDDEHVGQVTVQVQPHKNVGTEHKCVETIICSPAKKIKCEIEDELSVVAQNCKNAIDFQIQSQSSQDSCSDTNNKQNMTQRNFRKLGHNTNRTMGSKSSAKSKDNYHFQHNITTKRPTVHFGANSVVHLPHGKQMLYQEHRPDDVPLDLSVKKSRELIRETSITNNSTLKNSSNVSVENTPDVIYVDEFKLQIRSHMMGRTEATQGCNKQVSMEIDSGKNKFSKNALDGSKESTKTCKWDAEVVADDQHVVKAKKDFLPKLKPQQEDISTKKTLTKAKWKK